MRTLEKDVLMICKGWFNQDSREGKEDKWYDALFDYQSSKTFCSKKCLTDTDVFEFSLIPTMKELFSKYDWIEMIKERMAKDIIFAKMERKEIVLSQKYINNLCMRQIANLNVKNIDNDKWIIDMSDYDDVKPNIDWWRKD